MYRNSSTDFGFLCPCCALSQICGCITCIALNATALLHLAVETGPFLGAFTWALTWASTPDFRFTKYAQQ